jgi:RNA 2',3'-cyclic 3'-phosphodiesterase
LTEELERRATAAARRAKVTWIPADRMHLTIRFIGEVDDGKASMVRQALEEPLTVAPFRLTLCGAGTFPKSGTPRVVWLGVTEGREQLLCVERAINARLTPLGILEEDRAYSPHLTLARVRDPAGLKSTRLLDGLTDRRIGTTHIDTITLFQSKLSPKGPTYTPLLRTPLKVAG